MAQTITVAAPTRRPRQGGIKAYVDEFINEPRLAAATNVAWDDPGCGLPSLTRAGCFQTTGPTTDKVFDGFAVPQTIGESFAQYKGVTCWLGGDNEGPSYEEQARTLLEQGEEWQIEKALWDWANLATSTSTATSLAEAIAEADEIADQSYIGQPLIIVSRYAGAIAGTLSQKDTLITKNGTPVLATSAVPDGVRKTKLVIVGQPAVYASPVVVGRAPLLGKNKDFALAERVYAIGVDCQFRHVITIA